MYQPKTIATGVIFFLAAAAAFAFGSVGIRTAHAADCGVTAGDVAQITAIQNNPDLNASEEIVRELALRKILVGETIICAQAEAQTFKKNLSNASVAGDAQLLQSQLLGDLSQASGFYDTELAKLNVVGVAGTKAIAQEVLSWRAGTFLPLSENVNNFILWSRNQNLFNTAQTRMNQTAGAVAYLENSSPNPDLQAAFNSAQSSFNDAESKNTAAKTALTQNLSPDQSLALIKQSLDALSSTYQGFFDVSTIIKKNLSH